MGRTVNVGVDLPTLYDNLTPAGRRRVRERYVQEQGGMCWFCKEDLDEEPPTKVTDKPINLRLFPPGFLKSPVHLQHDHVTGLTEGAVHGYCNAVLWQYMGR